MIANYMCGIKKNLYDNCQLGRCQTNLSKLIGLPREYGSPIFTDKRRVYELSGHRLGDDEQPAPGVFIAFLDAGLQGQVVFARVHFAE